MKRCGAPEAREGGPAGPRRGRGEWGGGAWRDGCAARQQPAYRPPAPLTRRCHWRGRPGSPRRRGPRTRPTAPRSTCTHEVPPSGAVCWPAHSGSAAASPTGSTRVYWVCTWPPREAHKSHPLHAPSGLKHSLLPLGLRHLVQAARAVDGGHQQRLGGGLRGQARAWRGQGGQGWRGGCGGREGDIHADGTDGSVESSSNVTASPAGTGRRAWRRSSQRQQGTACG